MPAIQVWRPKGIMVGHLHEHKGAVTKIAVSPDGKVGLVRGSCAWLCLSLRVYL